jgi:hypothetical protein
MPRTGESGIADVPITAYDILWHAGVDLAKKDFLGMPRPT